MREGPAGCGAQEISDYTQIPEGYHDQKTALTRFRRLVALDPGDLLRADPEAR
jgi:hypothetical protein